jgi:hypothetical protein
MVCDSDSKETELVVCVGCFSAGNARFWLKTLRR